MDKQRYVIWKREFQGANIEYLIMTDKKYTAWTTIRSHAKTFTYKKASAIVKRVNGERIPYSTAVFGKEAHVPQDIAAQGRALGGK